jgi:hypothetical protein
MDLLPSSAPHWHLLLNHFPTVGAVGALGLLLAALYLRSEDLQRASLVIYVIIGLLAIPTYITGAATAWDIQGNAGISRDLIASHQDAAMFAFSLLLITGWLSWLALWQYRRISRPQAWLVPAVLIGGVLALIAMFQTGRRGGYINHPELLSDDTLASVAGAAAEGSTTAVANFVVNSALIWPTLEAAHFMGMALLFGVVVLTVARVFGVARQVPYTAFHRLLPLGVFGLVVNVITGMMFFVADSGRYTAMTNSFFPKMALIVIGGIAVLYFTIFDRPWGLKSGDEAPMSAKVVAAATALMWTGVLVYGRLLPYLEGG